MPLLLSTTLSESESEPGPGPRGAEFCGGRSCEPLFFDVDRKQHAIAFGVWLKEETVGFEVVAAGGRSSRPAPRNGRALGRLPAAFALKNAEPIARIF